jgi:hypothetical protein
MALTAGMKRAGVSAPEAIVALLLGLFIVHLGFSTMAQLRTAHDRLAMRTDGLVAMRLGRHVLRRELRHGRPGQDWWSDGDSLWLRAFRGTAVVCPYDTATVEVTVSYRGDRRADPSKDSVLLISPLGDREVRGLSSVTAAAEPCGSLASAAFESWRLDAPVLPGSVIARLYERGSYHVNASALRYRRGASGRQPLTPEVWSSETAWVRSGGRLVLSVDHGDPSAGGPWSAFLSWLP